MATKSTQFPGLDITVPSRPDRKTSAGFSIRENLQTARVTSSKLDWKRQKDQGLAPVDHEHVAPGGGVPRGRGDDGSGATRIVRPSRSARRTSSSDTKLTAGAARALPEGGRPGRGGGAGSFEPSARPGRRPPVTQGAEPSPRRAAPEPPWKRIRQPLDIDEVERGDVVGGDVPAYAPQPRLIEGASPVV